MQEEVAARTEWLCRSLAGAWHERHAARRLLAAARGGGGAGCLDSQPGMGPWHEDHGRWAKDVLRCAGMCAGFKRCAQRHGWPTCTCASLFSNPDPAAGSQRCATMRHAALYISACHIARYPATLQAFPSLQLPTSVWLATTGTWGRPCWVPTTCQPPPAPTPCKPTNAASLPTPLRWAAGGVC